MSKTKKKRTIRARHTGRLELRGQTFVGRWMVGGRRFSASSGIKIADYGGDERKARQAAEDWLKRKLAALRASDAIKGIDKDEASIREQQKIIFKGAFQQLDESRATAADTIPPLKVADAFDRLVKSPGYKVPKPQTIKNSRARYCRFTKWMERNHAEVVELREVTPAIAWQYAEDIKATLGAATYNCHLVTLTQLWTVLADEIKAANPWEKIPKQTEGQTFRRELSDAEIAAIFKAAQGDRDLTLLFGIMYFTGARLSDAATMRWECVHFNRGVLDFTAIKTGGRCKPPLFPALRQMLEQTPPTERTGHILPDYASLYATNPQALSALVTDTFKAAGIETSVRVNGDGRRHPAATAHSFRHSFISRCGNSGVPLEIVRVWVGHLNEEMSRKYFHSDERATILYAQSVPRLTAAPLAFANHAGDAHAIETIDIPAEATDAAEGRFRAFCATLDGMSADELRRAAKEIENRLNRR